MHYLYEQEKINKQIRKKEAERMLLKTEVDEVDEYMETIGEKMNIDRSRISRKISDCLQNEHKAQK